MKISPDNKDNLCEWTLDRLEVFLDGELPPDEAAKLEAHLEACRPCARERDFAWQVNKTLRGLPEKFCPDTILDSVLTQIGAEVVEPSEAPRGRLGNIWWRMLQPAAVAATLILVFTMTVFIGQRQQFTVAEYLLTDDSLELTPEAVELAKAEVKWTFAYIGNIGRRTGQVVRDDALYPGVVVPIQRAVKTAFDKKTPKQPQQNGRNGG